MLVNHAPESQSFNIINVSFNVIRENKILTKISEFTVIIKTGFAKHLIIFTNEFNNSMNIPTRNVTNTWRMPPKELV